MPVPEHALPFQHELGTHPTLEQMQLMVSRKKMRPVFPDVWKDTHQVESFILFVDKLGSYGLEKFWNSKQIQGP
jgi:hypothetical protein